MATPNATQEEPANNPSSRDIAKQSSELGALLTSVKLGVRVSGVVLSGDEGRLFEGVGKKSGKPYKFAKRQFQVWTGSKAVTCQQTADDLSGFGPLPIGQLLTFAVSDVSIENGQIAFDVEA